MATIVSNGTIGGYYVEHAETFTLDNGDVLMVTHDTDSDSPLEWGHDVVAYVHRSGYHMTLPDCDSGRDVLARAFAEYVYRGEPTDKAIGRAMRYARTFYDDNRAAALFTVRGYSKSDWADILFIGDDEDTITFIAQCYDQYFRGDVWSVASDNDAIGGIYADTAEEAASIYVSEYYANGE